MSAPVYSLNVHASYACRHSGACCTAGWTIPVEAHLLPIVGSDRLEPDERGACPRYDRTSGLCQLHRDHGPAMLPESCAHFPRRALVDARGTSVTLSHFCPTAASLLLDSDTPLGIVADPPAFPAGRAYEGLDARGEWPPLLRPTVLFDPPSFTRWEHHLVETLGQATTTVDDALEMVAATAERLRAWHVERGTLLEWTSHVVHPEMPSRTNDLTAMYRPFRDERAFVHAADAVPAGLAAPRVPERLAELDATWVAPVWDALAPLALRYLAARAFASWTAYQSRGIRTQVAELFMTAAVLRVECVRAAAAAHQALNRDTVRDAVRATELLLVHLVDRDRLLPWLGKVEDHVTGRASH